MDDHQVLRGLLFFWRVLSWIVSIVVALVIGLFVAHALLAMRKFPIDYRQFATFRTQMRSMHHEDTTLWFCRRSPVLAMFFLAPGHLYMMLTRPDRIGPFESADRVWSEHWWPLYILLLLAVELHGGIGLYRLAVKWGWFTGGNADGHSATAEAAQVGDHRSSSRARSGHARGVHAHRH